MQVCLVLMDSEDEGERKWGGGGVIQYIYPSCISPASAWGGVAKGSCSCVRRDMAGYDTFLE